MFRLLKDIFGLLLDTITILFIRLLHNGDALPKNTQKYLIHFKILQFKSSYAFGAVIIFFNFSTPCI
jgi:hypothetical protein